jgi:DNA topoisomerase-3
MVLQQPIDRAQAVKLLTEHRTDLLRKFISAKTGRVFPAYLVVKETGKVAFEFPEHEHALGKSLGG